MAKHRSQLKLARNLVLPLDAVTETFAFLGRRGAGKTYAAMVLAEEMLDCGAQIVVLDPVSKWWGFRLAADGHSEAYHIPVFGGPHGDVPLSPQAGNFVADVVVESGLSVVLDLSGFNSDAEQRRFVTDFAKRLYRRKQRQEPPTPLHLFLEEAEEFLPQDQLRDQAHLIGAIKKLIKLGRNYGLGCTLVTQRSADVNKKGLSQVGTMVALQTTSPHDRKAVREWAHGLGQRESLETRVDIVLPNLDIGQAMVWSPAFDIAKKATFRKKRTFDTSATPKLRKRKKIALKKLSEKELKSIESSMTEAIEDARANDPKLLRKRIAELERELVKAQKTARTIEVETVVERWPQAELKELVDRTGDLRSLITKLDDLVGYQEGFIDRVTINNTHRRSVPARRTTSDLTDGSNPPAKRPSKRPAPPVGVRDLAVPMNGVKLKRGARKMLECLAVQYPKAITRSQLGTLSGFKSKGSTFSEYISILKRNGLAAEGGGRASITDAGLAYVGPVERPTQTTEQLLAYWNRKLKKGARMILDYVVARYPNGVDRSVLAEEFGYGATTMSEYVSILRRLELVTIDDGLVTASETLFP